MSRVSDFCCGPRVGHARIRSCLVPRFRGPSVGEGAVGLYRRSDRTLAPPKRGKKPAWWRSRFKSPRIGGTSPVGNRPILFLHWRQPSKSLGARVRSAGYKAGGGGRLDRRRSSPVVHPYVSSLPPVGSDAPKLTTLSVEARNHIQRLINYSPRT